MRGLGGEVFARLPGRRGLPGGGNGAQNGAILTRGSPESTRNSPFLTPNSPLLTQIGPKKPGVGPWLARGSVGRGFCAGNGVGGCLVGVRKIFGLLNFCCTREACFIWEVFSVSHPRLACRLGRFAAERHRRSLTPLPRTHSLRRGGCAGAGGGDYSIHLISKGELALPLWNPFTASQG